MRKILLLVVLFIVGVGVMLQAQDKTCVGIMPFTTSNNTEFDKSACSMTQESVANAFVKNKRFTIVDRTKMEGLKAEKELQKSEDFIDGKVIESGKGLGAQYLISGHITSASITDYVSPEGYRSYAGSVSVALKVIDIITGQVIASETLSKATGGGVFAGFTNSDTKQEAINKAVKGLEGNIDKFIKTNFPIIFVIAEIQEVSKKGEAKTLMVAGGAGYGLKKGDKLKVVEVSELEVGGKKLERKKEIGELKITKVEDDNFSTCSVVSGGLDINTKFIAKGNLQIITKE
jgi:curli biogenesis system outer membrane secretion channel CsgG